MGCCKIIDWFNITILLKQETKKETKNNTALTYQLYTIIQPNGPYYLCNPQTLFEKLKNLYSLYWKDISEKNYSDELAINLIQKYNYILTHIS